MKTYYVGGKHFFNRFSNLEAAIERAEDDDIIELHKDTFEAALYITKNITINGNGHIITPKAGKSALDCASYVTLNHILFPCKPRTNAIVLRNGGKLTKIRTSIIGPARALYPTVVQKGGKLELIDSDITFVETCDATSICIQNTHIKDYYGGFSYLDNNDYTLSKFRGKTQIHDSVIECSLLEGNCELQNTMLNNFNKAKGNVTLKSCELSAKRGTIVKPYTEPEDGPLKDLKSNVIPYALHIAGGKVIAEDFICKMGSDCIGFYMTSGSLDIKSTELHNSKARHLMKGGSVVFNDVTDDGFYEIKKARCGIIRSCVNTSSETKSAMEELDSMIGLESVKRQLRTIMNTISVNMAYPEKDFGFSHHMVFAGDPGTGKTTAAKLVAQALFEVGAIQENKYMEVPASQLIKGFVGQTGEHVEAVMKKALGGVLFIDEAYELAVKDNQNTFNNDALSVILRYMEDYRDRLVIIAAGYEKEMKEFLASNVGLTRRFQWVHFENYTTKEMASIFISMAKKYKEDFSDAEPENDLTKYFDALTEFYLTHPDAKGRVTNGGNGGLVRNLFQQIIFERNNRVAMQPKSTMKITHDDMENGFANEMKKAINVQYGRAAAER